MNHYRTVYFVIRALIFQLKTLRQIVIYLNGPELPTSSKGILHHKVKFWAIERSFAIFYLKVKPLRFGCIDNCIFCFFPVFQTSDVLFRLVWIANGHLCVKVFKAQRAKNIKYEVNNIFKLLIQLIGGAKNMCIVLGKSSNTG